MTNEPVENLNDGDAPSGVDFGHEMAASDRRGFKRRMASRRSRAPTRGIGYRWLKPMGGRRTSYINRAPVLTLWAAVVAERAGFSSR